MRMPILLEPLLKIVFLAYLFYISYDEQGEKEIKYNLILIL